MEQRTEGVKVFVGQDEGVFLELVGYLAHLAGDIGVGAGVDKLLDKFQLVLVQVVEHQLRVVKQDSGCTTGGFVFLQVGADIGAQLGDVVMMPTIFSLVFTRRMASRGMFDVKPVWEMVTIAAWIVSSFFTFVCKFVFFLQVIMTARRRG